MNLALRLLTRASFLFQAPTTSKTIRKISTFVFVLPLIIALLATYVFWDKMPPSVQSTFEKLVGSSTSASVSSGNEEVWDGTMARKRANKKRA